MNTYTPLDRVWQSGAVAEMRRHTRGFWRKHGLDTALWVLLTGAVAAVFWKEWIWEAMK